MKKNSIDKNIYIRMFIASILRAREKKQLFAKKNHILSSILNLLFKLPKNQRSTSST
jgi:hypothetical protein